MAIVFSETADSWRRLTDGSSWANARGTDASSSTAGNNTAGNYQFAIYNRYTGGRGASTYYCGRAFFEFDLSGESGTVSSAFFRVYVDNLGTNATNESTIYCINATTLDGDHTDYGKVFKATGTTLLDFIGSDQSTTTDGYLDITLNSDGITALNNNIGSGRVTIGCMGYYDYNNSAPSIGGDYVRIKFTFADNAGTYKDPHLNITYAAVAADNAVFFGTNF
jgi:hypothetical protein